MSGAPEAKFPLPGNDWADQVKLEWIRLGINFVLGWLLLLLSLPFIILTLGLFTFVVNAFMLWITDKILEDFKIDGFGWTLVAALCISVVDTVLKRVLI